MFYVFTPFRTINYYCIFTFFFLYISKLKNDNIGHIEIRQNFINILKYWLLVYNRFSFVNKIHDSVSINFILDAP